MSRAHGAGISERIERVMQLDPDAPAVWDRGRWWTWGHVSRLRHAIDAMLGEPASGEATVVGLYMRNRFGPVAAVLALVASRRTILPFSPMAGETYLSDEIRRSNAAAVLADADDWADTALHRACRQTQHGSAIYPAEDEPLRQVVGAGKREARPAGERPGIAVESAGIAVEMLTSGTTGPPKRIGITFGELDNMLRAVGHYRQDGTSPIALQRRPAIISAPLVHSGGFGAVLRAAAEGRPIALLERFEPQAWSRVVEEHAPRFAGLPPTALFMLLEAEVPPQRLRSLRAIAVGTAPLDPALADRFEERFSIPLLPNYGATEFPGGLAGWTLADRERFWDAKRRSAGRPHPGAELRVVDPETAHELPPGEAGVLEVRTPGTRRRGRDGWVRTNDLVSIDSDGFVFVHGRVDDAIIRGGFKVLTSDVERALETHPMVRGAGVVGVPDPRLGMVPMAAVEVSGAVTAEELLAWVRDRLARYQIPVEIRVVDELPRTPSMKVSKPRLRAFFSAAGRSASPSDGRDEAC